MRFTGVVWPRDEMVDETTLGKMEVKMVTRTLRNNLFATAAASALVMAAGGVANAASVTSQFFPNVYNQLSDNSADYLSGDLNGNGLLDVGDSLTAIFDIGTIENSSTGVTHDLGGTSGNDELSGISTITVLAKIDTGNQDSQGNELYNYIFGPNAGFEATYGAGAMIAMFDDSSPDYTRTGCATTAGCIATATDGTLLATLGFTGDLDQGWVAQNSSDNPAIGRVTPLGTALGTFNWSLGQVGGPLFAGGANLGLTPAGVCFTGLIACGGDQMVQWNGSGGLVGNGAQLGQTNTPFDIFDNVDVTVHPVPEPATLSIFGAGLLMLGMAARRRRKAGKGASAA